MSKGLWCIIQTAGLLSIGTVFGLFVASLMSINKYRGQAAECMKYRLLINALLHNRPPIRIKEEAIFYASYAFPVVTWDGEPEKSAVTIESVSQ